MKLLPVSAPAPRWHPDAARRFVPDATRWALEEQAAVAASPKKITSDRENITVHSVARDIAEGRRRGGALGAVPKLKADVSASRHGVVVDMAVTVVDVPLDDPLALP